MNSESEITEHLPPDVLGWLYAYQREHQFTSLEAAIVDIICKYYAQAEHFPERVADLERRVNALSREVIHLRQQLPENYDRLREQLAAVRLSHSGILHNLRDRVEALESEVFAGRPSAADAEADS
ncbi:hypothetical protein D3A95_01535 [Thermosynechococcus sichuanensis E542]|uniref:Uncharacterized protein n=1 Tax=Thermosynechococcus sichuanensis E542 TaxID=2016101 RepID=A0A3B7MD30_9CYAN|nr:hypothetical protein [Thermosynechococcus vestitus]AXY67321.1 hypothetical protein D3A95_01535 [Thermosynechococcus vestitus E542]